MCLRKMMLNIGLNYKNKLLERLKNYLLKQGIKFLGFTFKLANTGKVLMLLDKDNVKKRRRKIKKHKGLLDKGKMTEEQIEQSFEGWKAHAEKGNSYNTIKSVEKFYRKTMMG